MRWPSAKTGKSIMRNSDAQDLLHTLGFGKSLAGFLELLVKHIEIPPKNEARNFAASSNHIKETSNDLQNEHKISVEQASNKHQVNIN